jgi:hypothetical protein
MNGARIKNLAFDTTVRVREEARHLVDPRTLRAMCPAVLAVALYPWIKAQIDRELPGSLFRDPAMSQYTGWCIRHGVRLYRDVGAPDGPIIHLLHALMQMFVGTSDAGARRADLVVHLVGSAAMGAALAPRFAISRLTSVVQRCAWAALGCALWLAWYLPAGGTTHTVDRDPYYALFGYLSIVLVYASADYELPWARALAFAGGFLGAAMLFTRHSGIAYPAVGALALLCSDDPVREQRTARLKAALLGASVGFVSVLAMVAAVGSLSGFWFWYLRYPFQSHRFIGHVNSVKLFTEVYTEASRLSVVVLVGVLGAVASRVLPRRATGFAFVPMLFLIAASLVGKGWPQHVMQTTAGANVILLVLLSRFWANRPERQRWSVLASLPAALVLLFTAYYAMETLQEGPLYNRPAEQFADAAAALNVGNYVRAHTKPDDAVFLYGHEAHVMLAAERRPAIPYYVNMVFDIDNFLKRQPPEPGEEPTKAQLDTFNKLQAYIDADACPRLSASPPAAMVFLDRSLGIWGIPYGVADVAHLCPGIPDELKEKYHEVPIVSADYHIYLRNDRR